MNPLDNVSDQIGYWHILFIDLVAYSQQGVAEQRNAINRLNKAVAQSRVLRAHPRPRIIYLPTGDGVAICLDNQPEKTLEVACELHLYYAMDNRQLRIGICSGIAFDIEDINRRPNLAGSGLNLAQRLMNCGSPGHILVADLLGADLAQLPRWREMLHGPYTFEVKHGQRLTAYNFCDPVDGVGNAEEPSEYRAKTE